MKTRRRALVVSVVAILVASTTLKSRGAVDAFIRFTDPAGGAVAPLGESIDDQFSAKDGWIAVASFDNGILNSTTIASATGGTGAGKTAFRNFHFSKHTGIASPALFKMSATGGHYEQAELALRQTSSDGKALKPFYIAKFRTVYVTSITWSGPGDEGPEESIAILYFAIEWSFTRFDPDGTISTTITVNWNQVANTGGAGSFLPPTLSYPPSQSVLIGGSLIISPLTGPSDSDGIASIVIVSKGDYTGDIALDPATGIVRIAGAAPVGGPYTIVVRATDGLGFLTEASFNLVVNPEIPPLIANPDTASRMVGKSIKIPVETLTANDSAGAIFEGLPSDTTRLGGHVSLSDAATILYEPPTPDPATDDTFTYRIRDSFGQTQNGIVTVKSEIPALVANPDTTSRVFGKSLKIAVETLTANDSAGAIFDGLPSDTTRLGGHVSLSEAATILYEPPTPDPATDDTFTYRIRDSFGQTQNGTVTVGVENPTEPFGNLTIRVTPGQTTLQFAAIPARKYQLQRATDVAGPWNDLGDVITADINGNISWTDPDPSSPRFYRAYNVP